MGVGVTELCDFSPTSRLRIPWLGGPVVPVVASIVPDAAAGAPAAPAAEAARCASSAPRCDPVLVRPNRLNGRLTGENERLGLDGPVELVELLGPLTVVAIVPRVRSDMVDPPPQLEVDMDPNTLDDTVFGLDDDPTPDR